MKQTKQMISIRVDPELLKALAHVSETAGTAYTGKGRTWLIENAIKETYKPFIQNNGQK